MDATALSLPFRHVECKGAFNVRDLGGYRTMEDRTLRWRTIFRADGLHRVPGTSETALAELGWRTVIDLRTSAETDTGVYRCDFLACPPEAMLTFLDRVRCRFGSAESYLVDAGTSPATLARLRELLLEP